MSRGVETHTSAPEGIGIKIDSRPSTIVQQVCRTGGCIFAYRANDGPKTLYRCALLPPDIVSTDCQHVRLRVIPETTGRNDDGSKMAIMNKVVALRKENPDAQIAAACGMQSGCLYLDSGNAEIAVDDIVDTNQIREKFLGKYGSDYLVVVWERYEADLTPRQIAELQETMPSTHLAQESYVARETAHLIRSGRGLKPGEAIELSGRMDGSSDTTIVDKEITEIFNRRQKRVAKKQ